MTRYLTSCFTLLFFASTFLLFNNCDNPAELPQEHERWSSADPLFVSYRVRQQKYEQGNLVHNSSFEIGKVKQVDSLTQSIVIEGWDFVGQNIRWLKMITDSISEGNPYIHSGNRSIKIVRKDANETDEIGNGVISDYIRVIPGNYNLSMYLNLIDIQNPKSRLGIGIYDAVEIRIIYYDKNKIAISGKQYSPFYNNYFDNSFKSESLSKFTRIDSTGWIHVQGRSHLFPVPDGDIQDDAKYIRIFIGLKGNGTMYIDDVNYEYTRWNFTQLERLESYFDTTFSLSQLIIPQPRSVQIMESIIYYRPYYKDIFPVILIPKNADKVTARAAKQLEKHIKQTISELTNTEIDSIPGLITNSISDQVRKSTVTFSLGETDLFKSASGSIPIDEIKNKAEGFLIYTLKDDLSVIYLKGNSPISDYFAVQAAIQLFDNKRLLFHNANIIDYPENNTRPLLLDSLSDYSIQFMQMTRAARFNQVYLPTSTLDIDKKIKEIKNLGTYSVRLYTNLRTNSEDEFLSNREIPSFITNNRSIIDGYALIDEPVGRVFPMQNEMNLKVQSDQTLRSLVSEGYPLEVQSGNSHSGNLCSDYLDGILQKNSTYKNISYIWTGNGSSTWKLDEADYLYNTNSFSGETVFMDLTLFPRDRVFDYFMYDSLWPYKLAKASLFESFDNEVVHEIYDKADKTILAFKVENVFDKIRLYTASDFFWNSKIYSPDLSLYRALITVFGVRRTKDLLYFNDYYFKARSELILANNPKNYQKHIRRADTYIKEMKSLQNSFVARDQLNKNEELVEIISGLLEEIELTREKLAKSLQELE